MFQEWAGNKRDVSKGRAAKAGDDAQAAGGGGPCRLRQMIDLLRRNVLEVFHVVFRIEPVFIEWVLAHDAIEEIATARHTSAGRNGGVAFGIDEGVAIAVGG